MAKTVTAVHSTRKVPDVLEDIQKLTKKFTTEQDTVQIDTPDFDPDIDGPDTQWAHHTTVVVSVHELFTSPESELADATNTQEETADNNQLDTGYSNSEDPHRPSNFRPFT